MAYIPKFQKGSVQQMNKSLSETLKESMISKKHDKKKLVNRENTKKPVANSEIIKKPVINPGAIGKPIPTPNKSQYVKKQYTQEEIKEKLTGYISIHSQDYNKLDIGDFVRFMKGDQFFMGGQIVYLGFNKEKKSPFWLYTPSLIPNSDGKFPNRYTVYWKDVSKLWKRSGHPIEIEILQKRISRLEEKIDKIMDFIQKYKGDIHFSRH